MSRTSRALTPRAGAPKPYARPSKTPRAEAPTSPPVAPAQSAKARGARDAPALGGARRAGSHDYAEVDKIDPSTVIYPCDVLARSRFKRAEGKAVTPHQWKVYDHILAIPQGRVTTYGAIAKALGSSAQSVGGALRDNPFAPLIPCHRVIATTLLVGGFQGEWEKNANKTGSSTDGVKLGRKLALLEREGVLFDDKGLLVGGKATLWMP